MDFFSQTYNALRGPVGAPQLPAEIVGKLADRLSQNTLLGDRRAAVLSLKGLSRDCKAEVGDFALAGLLDVLDKDSDLDADIAKAVLETLTTLCEASGGESHGDKFKAPGPATRELGMKYTDAVLSTSASVDKLFQLLGDPAFYTRFATLQFLQVLLHNRRSIVQGYFIKSPVGFTNVISVLEEKREIIRNEGLIMVQSLISQNSEIQKILAFEGAFEKLIQIITAEGGIEGGVVVQDSLNCIDGLLRYNVSNQSYFRETSLLPLVTPLLLFPSNLPPSELAPQEFSLQFWEPQKSINAGLVVGIVGMLIGNKGSNAAEQHVLIRCLLELALASNAPTVIKTQALRLLPTSPVYPGSVLTPYQPVPDTNGEEWDRLEPVTALDALVNNVVDGEYGGLIAGTHGEKRDALEFRAYSLTVFENFTRQEDVQLHIIRGMLLPDQNTRAPPPILASLSLLSAVTATPSSPLSRSISTRIHLGTILLSTLLRSSFSTKAAAHIVVPSLIVHPTQGDSSGAFFVPADGTALGPSQNDVSEDNEDRPQTLLQTLSEHLSLAFLSRNRAAEQGDTREQREWDRLIIGYLTLLSQWLWENPGGVREFLEAGGLSVLVEPINLATDIDALVQGLCAFLLAICYEFNRESGEISRHTIHAIINRLSADTIVARMARTREDDRFKSVAPDSIVLPYPGSQPGLNGNFKDIEHEIWLDWGFVEFWKSGFYTMQRAINTDPDAISASALENPEQAALISSLRDIIRRQDSELERLQAAANQPPTPQDTPETLALVALLREKLQLQSEEIATLKKQSDDQNHTHEEEKMSFATQIAKAQADFKQLQESKREADKEQEDLLVFLEELTAKRKRDKERMLAAGMDISEDEAEAEDE